MPCNRVAPVVGALTTQSLLQEVHLKILREVLPLQVVQAVVQAVQVVQAVDQAVLVVLAILTTTMGLGSPIMQTQKDLLHFLGAVNYYRTSLKGLIIDGRFQNTAQILQPLYSVATAKLEKTSLKQVWEAIPALNIAFKRAKRLLINAVELAHPQYKLAASIMR